MNYFTKEELEYLRLVLTKRIMEECRPRIELDINGKIKSMIDNYCEHEYLITYACEACFVDECRCHKCAEIIYRGNE